MADFEAMSFLIGESVDQTEFETQFKDKIIKLKDDKYFIPSFIDFQYGSLNPENRVHKSVISLLEKEGAYKLLKSSSKGAKDKEKDKDKDKDLDKEKAMDKDFLNEELEKIYLGYPLKKGKAEGMVRLQDFITNPELLKDFETAVKNFAKECALNETAGNFIPHFSSFVGTEKIQCWKDYVVFTPMDRRAAPINKSEQVSASNQNALNKVLNRLAGGEV